jgi:hypothetical protein
MLHRGRLGRRQRKERAHGAFCALQVELHAQPVLGAKIPGRRASPTSFLSARISACRSDAGESSRKFTAAIFPLRDRPSAC